MASFLSGAQHREDRALRVAGEAACAGRTPGLPARIDGSQAFRVQSGRFKDAKPTPCKFDRAFDVQRPSPTLARGLKHSLVGRQNAPASTMTRSQVSEASARYYRLLPRSGDLTILLLKGHLLVEELLRQLIDSSLMKPSALKDARLETHQCICLAEALFHDRSSTWIWDALRKLNGIRNKLAHNLEPPGLDSKIVDFQQFVETNRNKAPGLRSVLKGHPIRLALGDVHTELLILLHREDQTDA